MLTRSFGSPLLTTPAQAPHEVTFNWEAESRRIAAAFDVELHSVKFFLSRYKKSRRVHQWLFELRKPHFRVVVTAALYHGEWRWTGEVARNRKRCRVTFDYGECGEDWLRTERHGEWGWSRYHKDDHLSEQEELEKWLLGALNTLQLECKGTIELTGHETMEAIIGFKERMKAWPE